MWRFLAGSLVVIAGCIVAASLWRLVTFPSPGIHWQRSGLVEWRLPGLEEAAALSSTAQVISVDETPVTSTGMWLPERVVGDTIKVRVLDRGSVRVFELALRPPTFAEITRSAGVWVVLIVFGMVGALLVLRKTTDDHRLSQTWVGALFLACAANLALGSISAVGPNWAISGYTYSLWLIGSLSVVAHLFFPTRYRASHSPVMVVALILVAVAGMLFTYVTSGGEHGLPSEQAYALSQWWLLACMLTSLGLVVSSWWRSPSLAERRQLGIVAVGAIAGLVPFVCLTLLPRMLLGPATDPAQFAFTSLVIVPAAYAYAITRYGRLLRDRWVAKLLVYTIAIGLAGIAYVAVGGLLDITGIDGPSAETLAFMAGLATMAGLPWIVRVLDWLLYGTWLDPVRVAANIIGRVDLRIEREDVPGQVCELVRRELQIDTSVLLLQEPDGSWHGAAGSSDIGVVSLAADSVIIAALERTGRLLERDEVLALENLSDRDRVAMAPAWVQGLTAIEGRDRIVGVLLFSHKSGATFFDPIDVLVLRIVSRVSGLVLENVRAYGRLRKASQQIARAAATERRKLARTLHDDIIQGLSALALRIPMLEGKSPTAADLEALRRRPIELAESLRLVCADLRQSALEGLTFPQAMRDAVAHLRSRANVAASFEFANPNDLAVPRSVAESALGILNEALRNVERHAEATAVEVVVQVAKTAITLTIADNGHGFDVDQARARAEATSHFGLLGINEQATAVEGAVTVYSQPGAGTRVVARLPMQGDPDDILL